MSLAAGSSVDVLSPKDSSLFKSTLRFYEHKQYKRGLKVCEQLLRKHPGHGESMAMKGLFLANLNRKEEGYEHVRLALKTSLKSHVCWHVYGLLYRADKNYEEAMKCYRNALRFDKDNFQILRDLAVLQLQMRQYGGLCESRYQILGLRTVLKLNWINLAIAYHLHGKLGLAVGVLDAVLDGFPAEAASAAYEVEQYELVLYKALILEEAGRLDEALECLANPSACRANCLFIMKERRAQLLVRLDRREEAKKIWTDLFDMNPDSRLALQGLVSCLDEPSSTGRMALLCALRSKYPRSLLLKEELLLNSPPEALVGNLQAVLAPMIERGILSSAKILKMLYGGAAGDSRGSGACLPALQEFIAGLEDRLHNRECDAEAGAWLRLLVAQHRSLCGEHLEAIELMDQLAALKGDVPEVFFYYAKILRRASDLPKAALCMNYARTMDPSDRFLNSKAVKYYLRAGQVEAAQELAVVFVKKGEMQTQFQDLIDMQVIWYAHEMGLAYQKKGEHQTALTYFLQIVKHFRDFYDDQFDFHNYILRRSTFSSYISMLRFEDMIAGHPVYKKTVKAAVKSVFWLHEQESTEISKDLASKLSLQASPLEEAESWMDELVSHRAKDAELLLLASDVYRRRGRHCKAMRALHQAYLLSPQGVRLSVNLQSYLLGSPSLDEPERSILLAFVARMPKISICHKPGPVTPHHAHSPATPILTKLLADIPGSTQGAG